MAGEPLAGARVEHGAAAEREHAVVLGERRGDRGPLEGAEVRLAGVDEDVGDRAALGRLDVRVGVAERRRPSASASRRADRGLAGAHRADQDDRGGIGASPEPQGVEVALRRCAGSR